MGMQMPEMDNFEATRRILTLVPNLLIIGQTAYAMAEERAKCLAAGMVDHIAKPLDPEAPVSLVLHYAAAGCSGERVTKASTRVPADPRRRDSFSTECDSERGLSRPIASVHGAISPVQPVMMSQD